jgi:hypothetical protein
MCRYENNRLQQRTAVTSLPTGVPEHCFVCRAAVNTFIKGENIDKAKGIPALL